MLDVPLDAARPDTNCASTPRADTRDLVGAILSIPANYWGRNFGQLHPKKRFRCRVVAFACGKKRAEDLWLFYDPDTGTEGAVHTQIHNLSVQGMKAVLNNGRLPSCQRNNEPIEIVEKVFMDTKGASTCLPAAHLMLIYTLRGSWSHNPTPFPPARRNCLQDIR